jgi:DNA-binding CsgD family transcriptional regulator
VLAGARADAEALGCRALAHRAAEESSASGARPRRVPISGVQSLTPSERRIAELAATGLTNREIAAELFLSAKTVEWHLGHVFSKLDVRRRRELAATLSQAD